MPGDDELKDDEELEDEDLEAAIPDDDVEIPLSQLGKKQLISDDIDEEDLEDDDDLDDEIDVDLDEESAL